jgi:hypothetical protein
MCILGSIEMRKEMRSMNNSLEEMDFDKSEGFMFLNIH